MKKIHKSIFINAPREKVWDIMLSPDTYTRWTNAFNPGSRFEGSWEKGSKMLFLGPDPDGGSEGGMVSQIRDNRPHEFISIEHLGLVKDGVEDTTSEEAKKWSPALENYTFKDVDGGTQLEIDQDVGDEYQEMFDGMWDKALEALKELAESE